MHKNFMQETCGSFLHKFLDCVSPALVRCMAGVIAVPATDCQRLLTGTTLSCLVTEAHGCEQLNNWPRVVTW